MDKHNGYLTVIQQLIRPKTRSQEEACCIKTGWFGLNGASIASMVYKHNRPDSLQADCLIAVASNNWVTLKFFRETTRIRRRFCWIFFIIAYMVC